MADDHEIEALKQGYEISLRQLRTLLTAQARLREAAEQTASKVQEELERLAEALCPGLVDELRKDNPLGMEGLKPAVLTGAIIRDVQHRLSRLGVAEATGQSLTELYDAAMAKSARLQEENTHLAQELAVEQERRERVETRLKVVQQTLESKIKVDPPEVQLGFSTVGDSLSPDRMPGWIQKWQRSQTYERDVVLLRILAETGVPRRSDAAELFGKRLDLKPTGGGVNRVFRRAAREGWVELIEVRSDTSGGAIYHLVRLTEKGRDAARLILGVDPVPSQATELLKRHKNGTHALLNLEAADLLREAGYEVDLFPAQIELPGQGEGREGLFAPDLVASLHGRTIFVEVERDTRKNPAERNRKWSNYHAATGGEFYVIVPDRKALDAIKGEILFWASRQHRLRLWMSNLCDARGKQGEDIWTYKRERGA